MAAKIGNRNAIGNTGGKPYSKDNREKAATLKGLSLDWMLKVMKGKDDKLKKEVVMKIATTCLPQVIAGDDESPLVVKVINYSNAITQRVSTPVEKKESRENEAGENKISEQTEQPWESKTVE